MARRAAIRPMKRWRRSSLTEGHHTLHRCDNKRVEKHGKLFVWSTRSSRPVLLSDVVWTLLIDAVWMWRWSDGVTEYVLCCLVRIVASRPPAVAPACGVCARQHAPHLIFGRGVVYRVDSVRGDGRVSCLWRRVVGGRWADRHRTAGGGALSRRGASRPVPRAVSDALLCSFGRVYVWSGRRAPRDDARAETARPSVGPSLRVLPASAQVRVPKAPGVRPHITHPFTY